MGHAPRAPSAEAASPSDLLLQAQLGSLAGTIIVADALHTQVGHARAVAVRGGQLMVTVKANQPTVHALVKPLPWAQVPVGHRTRGASGHAKMALARSR
jgi:hypothetical protein